MVVFWLKMAVACLVALSIIGAVLWFGRWASMAEHKRRQGELYRMCADAFNMGFDYARNREAPDDRR